MRQADAYELVRSTFEKKILNSFFQVGRKNDQEQEYFDDFYEELFTEIDKKYGQIEDMKVCENIGEHMIGNIYIKFRREQDADACVEGLNNRWYVENFLNEYQFNIFRFNGEVIYAELSPVTDFREACCRQYDMGGCTKGAFCNFMHLKPISRQLSRRLYGGGRYSSPDRHRRR